jgi:carnitine 3-dehydrogenase
MNEARYLQAFGDATDRFMELIGIDGGYIAAGRSVFTAETHIRHIGEVNAGDTIRVTTRVLGGDGRKMHLFHEMKVGEALAATGEHLLIHVDLATRKSVAPEGAVAEAYAGIAAAHAKLPAPEGAGRFVGQPRG